MFGPKFLAKRATPTDAVTSWGKYERTGDHCQSFNVSRRGLAKHPQLWKDGLNWFFREGHRHCGAAPLLTDHALPTLGQADTGAQPWERRLIERPRIQHYAWRVEKTYREWAWRLAEFIRPRDVESAPPARTSRPF
jgi:hypothetical protein